MQKVLVIASHPDDEVLGCGGTIAHLIAQGDHVTIAILGEGATSRSERRDQADPAEIEGLRQASRAAAHILGVQDVRFFGLPDNRFDTMPLLDVVKIIEELVREVRPAVVYTQHGGDLNVDHGITFRATMTATRPMQDGSVRELHAYEVASSTEWAFAQFEPVFRPNMYVDISATLELKERALAAYSGELKEHPHPRSIKGLRCKAAERGATSGFSAAEAFQTIWVLR